MTPDEEWQTARRRHIAWIRHCADKAEALAAEYRANADRIEQALNDAVEGGGR